MSAIESSPADLFAHWCPSVGASIDENDWAIIDCRCYTSDEFFAAQDSVAVRLDLQRPMASQ